MTNKQRRNQTIVKINDETLSGNTYTFTEVGTYSIDYYSIDNVGNSEGVKSIVLEIRTPGDFIRRNVNSDRAIDSVDALFVAQYYVGITPENFNPDAADVNCDGVINISDALLISQYYTGLISCFCCS